MWVYQSQRWRVLGLNFLLPWTLLRQHLHSVEDALKGGKAERVRVCDVTTPLQPFPVASSYLAYLLQRGHEVIITNQSQSIKHVDGLQGKDKTHVVLFDLFWSLNFSQHFQRLLRNFLKEWWGGDSFRVTVLVKFDDERRSRWWGIHEGSRGGQVILTQRTCRPTAPSMRSLLVK